MSETSIIAIILSLIAVGGTLVGTWLGRLLERNNETRKWRRERCLEAYADVLNCCSRIAFEADNAYGIECGSVAHVQQNDTLLKMVSEMYRTADKAMLLGPLDVYSKIDALTIYCGKEIAAKSVMCPKLSKSEWHTISVIDFVTIFSECRNAIRNDLGIFPKRYRIEGFKDYKISIEELNEEFSKGTITQKQKKQRLKDLRMKLKKDKKEWNKQDNQARKNK